MRKLELLKRIGTPGVFDVAKNLHYYFPEVSTDRINKLIMELDSVDQAIVVLCGKRDDNLDINSSVYMILKYRDEEK